MIGTRGIGRTSRLIEHAESLANEGKTVYIIAASSTHAKDIQGRVVSDRITVIPSSSSLFDWHTESIIGRDFVVLVDHFAYECRVRELQWNAEKLREIENDPRLNLTERDLGLGLSIALLAMQITSASGGLFNVGGGAFYSTQERYSKAAEFMTAKRIKEEG